MALDCNQFSDEDLVKHSLNNSQDYQCIVHRYEGPLLRYIQRISGLPQSEAQEVLQEVFLKAYRHLYDFNPKLKFSSWIYRIAHNQTLNTIKKKRHDFVNKDHDHFLRLIEKITDEHKNADDLLLEQESINKLQACLKNLSEIQKSALVLHFWEEKNYHEISDILRAPIGSIGTHIARAKLKLKECMEKSS